MGRVQLGGDVFKYACFCAKFSGIIHKKLFVEGIIGRVRAWLREKWMFPIHFIPMLLNLFF